MKKVLTLMLCLAMVLLVFAACAEEHQHTFSDQWMTDENEHWHPATCEHGDQVSEKGAHVYEDGQDTCSVCAYKKPHEHKFSTEWTSDETGHWHAADCGHSVKDAEAAHEKDAQGKCKTCGYQVCAHTYADTLTGDATHHWYAPTCGCEVEGKDKAEHVDENKDGKCDTEGCGKQFCEHTFDANVWDGDKDNHWNVPTCACTNAQPNKGAHADSDGDEKCDVCAKQLEHFHKYDEENWSSDANGHWHGTVCDGEGCADVKKDEAAHSGHEEDGVCDVCNFVVFKLYNVNVTLNGTATLLDMAGEPLKNNNIVKENTMFEFQIVVAKGYRLEAIANAEVSEPDYGEDGSATYTVVIKVTVDGMNVDVVVNKLSAVEVIYSGTGNYEYTKAWSKGTWDIIYTPEADGTYYIFAIAKMDTSNVDVDIYLKGDTNDYTYYCQFEGKAGEPVELEGYYFTTSKGLLEYEYYVVQVDTSFTLPALTGEGYTLPAKIPVTVEFTVPEAGVYLFYSSVGMTWQKEGEEYGSVEMQTFEATQANEKFKVTFWCNEIDYATFDFDWELKKLGTGEKINLGETTVKVDPDALNGYTFTAEMAGIYNFEIPDNVQLYAYYDYWGNGEIRWQEFYGYEWEMDAGESITFYTFVNPYAQNVPTEAFECTLEVKYVYIPTYDDNGNPYLSPDFSWEFSGGWDDVEYAFSVPAGTQFSIDGGVTWQSSLTVVVEANGTVDFLVKNDDGSSNLVLLTMQEVVYEFELAIGENIVSMIPGKEYTVTVSGAASVGGDYYYQLNWTDANISVIKNDWNMTPVTSGAAIEHYNSELVLLITLAGNPEDGAQKVVFNVADVGEGGEEPSEDIESLLNGSYTFVNDANENLYELTFESWGSGMGSLVFTDNFKGDYAEMGGTYNWYIMDGALVIKNATTMEVVNSFSLKAVDGELVLVVEPNEYKPAGGESVGEGLVVGDNAVDTDYSGVILPFVSANGGSYVFDLAEGENNAYIQLVISVDNWGIPVTDFIDFPYSFTLEAGESISFYICTNEMGSDTVDVVITEVGGEGGEGGEQPSGPVLNLGSNDFTIVMTNGWPTNVFATFTAPAAGTYVLKPADGEMYADVYDPNGEWIETLDRGYEFTLAAGQTVTFEISSTNYMSTEDVVSLVVEEKSAGPVLNVGNNSFTITINNGWPTAVFATFTAPADGTYVLKAAAGEIYADVYDPDGNWIEDIIAGYEFTLAAGETVTFEINTTNYMATEDIVDLVIEDKNGGNQPSGPVLNLGNNDFTIVMTNGWPTNVFATFTAPAAGTYVLKPADGEMYADVYDPDGEWIETLDRGYAFTLEAGQTITFEISSTNYMSTEDVVSLVVEEKASEPAGPVLNLGSNDFTIVMTNGWPTNVFATFTAPAAGTYVLKPADGEMYADVYDPNGEWIETLDQGYEFTLEAGQTITFEISSTNYMSTEDVVSLVVEEKASEPANNILTGGTNTVNGNQDGIEYTFTAMLPNTYTISYDETLAEIWLMGGFNSGIIASGGEFTLASGESAVFMMYPAGHDTPSVTFEVTIEVAGESADGGLKLGENHVEVPVGGNVKLTFTATEAGKYIFAPMEGESNIYMTFEQGNVASSIEQAETATLTLAAGETVTVIIETYDYAADVIDFTITLETASPLSQTEL